MAQDTNDLVRGTVDLLVLRALAGEPMHGFALSKWIDVRTRGELGIVDSALYKALHRLEDAGAVRAEWGASEKDAGGVTLANRWRPVEHSRLTPDESAVLAAYDDACSQSGK